MKGLFRHASTSSSEDTYDDVIRNIVKRDHEGQKLKDEDWIEQPKPQSAADAQKTNAPLLTAMARNPAVQYARQIQTLQDMGFSSMPAVLAAIAQTCGDVRAAINILVQQQNNPNIHTPATAPGPQAETQQRPLRERYAVELEAIRAMGIEDDEKTLNALERARGNVDHAVAIIFS